jgi:hypothetical protein
MSRKNFNVHKIAEEQSLAASFQTSPTVIKYLDNCAYQINVTTTDSIGTFAVQGSLDYNIDEPSGTVINPGTWVDLNLAGGTPFVNTADDQILIDLNQLPFTAIRLAYTSSTPGTGEADIYIATKQI